MAQDGYGKVYRSVMRSNLCVGAKALYALLCSYQGGKDDSWPTVKTLCEDLGVHEPTLKRYRKELEENGIIQVERRRSGNRNRPNHYRICTDFDRVKKIGGEPVDPVEKLVGQNFTPQNFVDHPCDFHGVENRPTEIRTATKINTDKKHSLVRSLTESVCDLFNQARSREFSKGRLKASAGEFFIKALVDRGLSAEKIMEEARAYLDAVKADDTAWVWFEDFVLREGDWRRRP